MSKADEYVRARLRGEGCRKAARTAGFAGGVPSADARRMWKMAQAVIEQPEIIDAAADERVKVDRELHRLHQKSAAHRLIDKAQALLGDAG